MSTIQIEGVNRSMGDTPGLFPEEGGPGPAELVSVSQVQQFLSCRKRWDYGYREGLRPRVEREYLTVGKLCHLGMQRAMNSKWGAWSMGTEQDPEHMADLGEAAIREEFERYMGRVQFLDEEVPTRHWLLEDAVEVFRRALRDLDPGRYEVATVRVSGTSRPATEVHFLFPVPQCGLMVHGFIDAVLIDREEGGLWCFDYKFRSQLSPDDDEQFNLQNAVYLRACREMGLNVAGTCTWQHLNSPSTRPARTKGGMSRARVRCTWEVYERELLDAGLDPADYADVAEKLSSVEWTRATREVRSEEFVENVLRSCMYPAARNIEAYRQMGMWASRSLDPWNCKRCQFQSLCQAELRGYDADEVRRREYATREER